MFNMKLFKTADEKLAKIGFKKVKDECYMVTYERYDKFAFDTQRLTIGRTGYGYNVVRSFDPNRNDKCIGLRGYELKLILRKMKEQGWVNK